MIAWAAPDQLKPTFAKERAPCQDGFLKHLMFQKSLDVQENCTHTVLICPAPSLFALASCFLRCTVTTISNTVMLLTQKHSSRFKGSKRQLILEPDISDCDLGTQIRVTPSALSQHAHSFMGFSNNKIESSVEVLFEYIGVNRWVTAKRGICYWLRHYLMTFSS